MKTFLMIHLEAPTSGIYNNQRNLLNFYSIETGDLVKQIFYQSDEIENQLKLHNITPDKYTILKPYKRLKITSGEYTNSKKHYKEKNF